jgi:hypothetical protein
MPINKPIGMPVIVATKKASTARPTLTITCCQSATWR